MIDFIKNIVNWWGVSVWFWIFFGTAALVFIVGIIMMIIKKYAFPVGRSTAAAGLVCGVIIYNFCIIAESGDGIYYSAFIICSGGILALIGGLVNMIMKKKGGKNAPAASASKHKEDQYDSIVADPIVPSYQNYTYEGTNNYPAKRSGVLPPDVEALLAKISRICAGGSTLSERREAATQLQKERAKPENKNNPEISSRLNKAIIQLLSVMEKK